MVRPVPAGAGAARPTSARAELLRRIQTRLPWLARQASKDPSARRRAAGDAPDVIRQDAWEQIQAQSRIHRTVALQISQVMQANLRKREELCRQLMERQDTNRLSAAWLRLRIEELDRLITQQIATADWHIHKSLRLRERVGAD